ncbi:MULTISPECIES: YqeG family HAD IIIA-type phosphatase [unclassified Leptolyngbya]|uniref:YqeG family HAD IIIA-type phosphatase n=1 Tax=unclassified Leptolyngbya TaxID=2650499 RepID=UPI001682A1B6|nr:MULTISPECIES: YqeG family HAD IIIA-type phosphatase [unclassified Leptolyngbya]MBD1912809.1 YqeG family HAD IIIA-type phosphatase [Leptolyngbya sp. FACHB-8]MBD2157756.1 YqeG family HAD IIIA-type phosphatase [Leptolyngbya sp. FACHB-16]
MSWGKLLQPDLVLGGPIIGLTADQLTQNNVRGMVLDVDETLVPMSLDAASEELKAWFEQIRPVVSLWLVSNNISRTRISRIAEELNVPFLSGARKPSRRKVRQAVDSMNIPVEQVAMVGDRLFTDVLVGNRLGMFTILVEPMVDPAQAARKSMTRSMEVWISQKLGASLAESP